jgi:hypothetical protein
MSNGRQAILTWDNMDVNEHDENSPKTELKIKFWNTKCKCLQFAF